MRKIVHGNQIDTRTDGSSPSIGGPIVVAGQRGKRGGQGSWGGQVIGIPLECRHAAGRTDGIARQESPWCKAPSDGTAEGTAGPNPSPRPTQVRISERVVDLSSG